MVQRLPSSPRRLFHSGVTGRPSHVVQGNIAIRRRAETAHCRTGQIKKKIVIPELCSYFGVSASTIRNDLRSLHEDGLITRTHGGAIINSKSGYEPLPFDKQSQRHDAKQAIALAAIEHVENGDVIAIGTGTTTFELIKLLTQKRDLTVILNDIYAAAYLEQTESINVIVVGGTLRKNFHYLQMPPNHNWFRDINIDKTFISCNGVHVSRGITTPDPALAHDLRQMIDASTSVYVICDSSKIGSIAFSRITDLDGVDRLITDNNIDDDDAAELQAAELDLEIVNCR
ncbi:MAG: DeoR/GlpR family DNA-binding transcription regulator [Planctomycetes bacterium]|nr:DeoR/GlpR family DNA-binding transcription regulator [Planctomycetota bacterium]